MGKQAKLIITAYSDEKYQKKVGEYTTNTNPKEYKVNRPVNYDQNSTVGASGTDLKYQHSAPAELSFTFLIDSTGVIPNSPENVIDELKKIRELMVEYAGDIHEPYYVSINWGTLNFQGKVSNFQSKHVLFKRDGTPIRTELNITVRESISDAIRASEEDKQSPDVSHLREVKGNDALPLMSLDIYGDLSYYLEVARANELDHFRELEPGQTLIFPPIDKQSS